MGTKKSGKLPAEQNPEVDMDRIKAMMGPLPDERSSDEAPADAGPKENLSPTTAPVISAASKAVSEAAEEANATLKALSADMGEAKITKVEDESAIPPTDTAEDLGETEIADVAEQIDGEGIAADDPGVVIAVNDIVAHEGDEVLEAEDEKRDSAVVLEEPKNSLGSKLKVFFSKPAVRWGIIIVLLALILAAALVPGSRYFALNNVGVRSTLSVTVIDSGTLQPLKNVSVLAAGVSSQTDSTGKAKLEHVKLGPTKLAISKRAFAPLLQSITIGWGSNPEGQIRLAPSGAQYTFIVTDYLSGKPVEKAEATSGEGNAVSDKDGRIVLTLDTSSKDDNEELSVQIAGDEYRTETIKITASNKETSAIKLVPARRDIFVSKRSGKYDVYTVDVDGKNETKIINGSGLERDDITLAPQQNGDTAAYVSTRENAHNADGYLLSTLYLVDTKTGNLTKADQSEQIQIIGWSADQHLVYAKIAAGTSGANPKRHRLITLNAKNVTETKEIASANAFNDVVMSGDKVLYAPSNALQDNPKPGLFSVNADGTNTVTITEKEVYNIFRTDYDTVTINASGTYYTYKIGSPPSGLTVTKTPSNTNRLYIDSISGGRSLWLDNRDGKGVVLLYDKSSKKDTVIASKAGLKLPMYWLNDNGIVFRINDGRETADYVISVNGGEIKKIQDVTDTSGIGRWYYY
ncbi:hypothetical protein BH10PAT3_BH10PAT3_5320 [soil metagenome]